MRIILRLIMILTELVSIIKLRAKVQQKTERITCFLADLLNQVQFHPQHLAPDHRFHPRNKD